jgi:plastocyanin
MFVRDHRLLAVLSVSVSLVALSVFATLLVPVASGRSEVASRQAATTKVAVSEVEFAFKLSRRTAPVGKVVFAITNNGTIPHNMRIGGKTSALVGPGSSTILTVTFRKPGRYPYLCTVPGHAAQGMKGTFVVTK